MPETTFSLRSGSERAPNALSVALERERARARPILDLTVSNPTVAGIPYAAEMATALADPGALRYDPSPFGLMSAREAVASTYREEGLVVDPSRIVLTASTSEAYAFLLKLLCDPGDDILVPQPSYPLFEHLARLEGVHLSPYELGYDGEWHVDVSSVEGRRGPLTRAIMLVHPNNPTGSYVKRTELAALGALGLPIVSDEVFSSFGPYPEDPGTRSRIAKSVLERDDGLVFALGGLSKLAALPQMKLAWIVVGGSNRDAEEALARLELIGDTFLSVSTPVQLAAASFLRTRHVAAEAVQRRVRTNLAEAARATEGSAVSLLRVEGGWYATLRLPRTRSEEEWALAFLTEDGVYVHPGHFFDFASEAFVVVSLLTPEADLVGGLARIVARVG